MPFEGDVTFEIRGGFGSRQSFTLVIAPMMFVYSEVLSLGFGLPQF
jgi:hypothetical protein